MKQRCAKHVQEQGDWSTLACPTGMWWDGGDSCYFPDADLDRIEQRCDQIEAQLETLKAAVALLLLDNNMPQKAKQVRDL